MITNSCITIQNSSKKIIKTEKLNVGCVALKTHFLLLDHPFWLVSVGAPSTWRCDMAHIGSLTLLWCWYCDLPSGGVDTGQHCMVPCHNAFSYTWGLCYQVQSLFIVMHVWFGHTLKFIQFVIFCFCYKV